jgi:hypothetical protein
MKQKLAAIPLIASKVITIVSTLSGVDVSRNSRQRSVVTARSIVYKILRDNEGWPLWKIAALFEKDHATVLHSLNCINRYMETEKDLNSMYKKCLAAYADNIDVDALVDSEMTAKKILSLEMTILDQRACILELKAKGDQLRIKRTEREEFFEKIRAMIPPNKEADALKKITTVLNGI